jgi:hypothetical protein
MMYCGDEDYSDDITSGPDPDDFEEYNRLEGDDYKNEDRLIEDVDYDDYGIITSGEPGENNDPTKN